MAGHAPAIHRSERALFNLAAQSESPCRIAHSRQAQAPPIFWNEDCKTGYVKTALLVRELARLEAHDVGLILPEDFSQSGHEAQLIAATDRDAVRHASSRAWAWIEGIGNSSDLRAIEFRQLFQAHLDIAGCQT